MVENLQIIMINKTTPQPSLFSSLTDQLNPRHPLYLLANKIDWRRFEEAFSPLYCAVNGRPAKPIRLMCGLLILKHVRNLSDESVVEQWSENAYYQYFCGMLEFTPSYPCNASELVHFRKRVGENGMELILSESIRVNQEDDGPDHHCTAFIDSTVQEKNVTYPTDAKLHKKIVRKVLSVVKSLGLPLRQSYTFVLKKIYRDQRFRNHPKNRGKALKADKRLRTIAGRLVRELRRNLKENHGYDSLLDLFERVLSQKRNSPGKIYSLHEPEVQCISKGKEHKKYEFGNKVSIVRSITGVILGAKSFRNEYDGHTIEESLRQVERITGKKIRKLAGDRGYRGKKEVGGTGILIPDVPNRKDSYYTRKKKHKLFCKRAGIEPTIGHLKSDFRLGRNFYKGVFGDVVNLLLAAAAYNFKRAMRVLWLLVEKICGTLFSCNIPQMSTFKGRLFNKGANIAQLKIAKAQQEEARLSFEQTLLNAGVEVNEALVQYQTAREKADYYDKQVASLQTAAKSTSLLMKHGNTTYLEVLTAQQTLLNAQLSQVANRFTEIQGVITLYQALGGGRM